MKHVEGSFVVGADGARSKIRSLLGIPMEGPAVIQELVNIHFLTPSLGKELRDSNPAMLYFVFNQGAVVVVVAHDLQQGEFVAQVGGLLRDCLHSEFACLSWHCRRTKERVWSVHIHILSWIANCQSSLH